MHLMTPTKKKLSREQDEQLPALQKLHRFPELHRFAVKLWALTVCFGRSGRVSRSARQSCGCQGLRVGWWDSSGAILSQSAGGSEVERLKWQRPETIRPAGEDIVGLENKMDFVGR